MLYVPVTQMDLISRYIGPRDDTGVKLNKLSSNEWQKTRSRVKKAVKDMADELIALYAKRSKTKGFAFSEDNDWQNDFEARFDYTETDDQLRCIEEIKQDMMKPTPMDRLLCGDVGFGKQRWLSVPHSNVCWTASSAQCLCPQPSLHGSITRAH